LNDLPWAQAVLDWRGELPRLGLLRIVLAVVLMAGRKISEGASPRTVGRQGRLPPV